MNDTNTPLAYFHTAGPAADPVTRLGWGLAAISVAVVFIIALLLLLAIFRRRSRAEYPPDATGKRLMPQRERAGLMWIYVGSGVSSVVLFACAVWTLSTLSAVAAPTKTPEVVVEVRGYQFWWRVRYLDPHGVVLLTTANEIHIPVGKPVRFRLSSGDVIHSFWVPSLGGKTDALPGQTNVTWLQGDHVGRYRGQCGEFCGAQHAHMALFVNVDTPEQFAHWIGHQRSPAPTPTPGPAGARVFMDKCAGCHAIRGTDATGSLAPDLTHLMTRETIAAGMLPNQPADLRRWIVDTQKIKPGSAMPEVPLDPAQLDALTIYLATLR